jgi:hypothetical protein
MKVYDYAIFFEDGTKDGFWLPYGPDEERGEDRFIYDYKNDPYFQRFNEETNGGAFEKLDALCAEHSLGFILVNPPREEEGAEW